MTESINVTLNHKNKQAKGLQCLSLHRYLPTYALSLAIRNSRRPLNAVNTFHQSNPMKPANNHLIYDW